jgi:hypothetical protein
MYTDHSGTNPADHDDADSMIDKPSQAEGSEEQADAALDEQSPGDDGVE